MCVAALFLVILPHQHVLAPVSGHDFTLINGSDHDKLHGIFRCGKSSLRRIDQLISVD